ncbi:MAG: ribosome maturation factor RimP [Bdellovibrionales bacterium]|nr:ribosome maturation factor RimP [Bdellovibrionales bacterium]
MNLEAQNSAGSLAGRIEALLAPQVKNLGFDLLDLEYLAKGPEGGPVLRLFIERPGGEPITFDDCAAVDRGLDPVLESSEFDRVLPQGFSLEVSSPGVDRPLRRPEDFERFRGNRVRVHTFRALRAEELGNDRYFRHHEKQKNFFGVLLGHRNGAVEIEADGETFHVPMALVTKAHLDVAAHLADELETKRKKRK